MARSVFVKKKSNSEVLLRRREINAFVFGSSSIILQEFQVMFQSNLIEVRLVNQYVISLNLPLVRDLSKEGTTW